MPVAYRLLENRTTCITTGATHAPASNAATAPMLKASRSVPRLVTPQAQVLSAGLVCFDVANRDPVEVVDRLYDRFKIVASVTPYAARHVRLGPSILNSPAEIDRALQAIRVLT